MNGNPLTIAITCYPTIGGSGVIATTLGVELAKRGHEIHFISYERPFRLPENLPRVHFHPVAINSYGLFKYPDYTLPLSVEMARVSCEHKLDVLHVHYAVPHATAAALAMCMLPPEKRPRVITTLHGTDTTLLGNDPGYEPIIHHSLVQSDAVTAVSHYLAAETRRVFDYDHNIHVIHNFFQPSTPKRPREMVREDLGISPDDVVIIHSSNLRPLKRIDLLVETLARVKQQTSNFKMLVLAGGDFSPFMAEAEALGIADHFVVRKNVIDIEDYLQCADIGLYTSESESFCLSILEAMYFSVPSVSTRVGGIPEVVEDGENGILAEFGDVDALANGVVDLIRNPDKRRRLGESAERRAHAYFSTENIVPQYENLYRRITQEQASAECIG